jgi:hypothetical protein
VGWLEVGIDIVGVFANLLGEVEFVWFNANNYWCLNLGSFTYGLMGWLEMKLWVFVNLFFIARL